MADNEEEFVGQALARAKLAGELEPRLGQLMVNALYEHLQAAGSLPAPGGKSFALKFRPPEVDKGGDWSFLLEFEIPDNAGYITFLITQFGRGIDVRNINLPLPPQDFEIPVDPRAPLPEHRDAYHDVIDRLRDILETKGFLEGKSFTSYDHYLGSDTIRISVRDPRVFRLSIASAFQKTLLKSKFPFVISMQAAFGGKRILDAEHLLIIRRDRIAPDWNAKALKTASRGKFSWR